MEKEKVPNVESFFWTCAPPRDDVDDDEEEEDGSLLALQGKRARSGQLVSLRRVHWFGAIRFWCNFD